MGRHGGGPTGRTRTSWPVVAIGLLVVAAIGFGIWLESIRSVADPIDKDPVDAYAVVVSSPDCTAGSSSTVIDLTLTIPVRSSISACGRRVGERIAVQYLAGQPDQARVAGTAVAHNSSARSWLPIAMLVAGLLAVIGILSLLIDRGRSRHDSRTAGAGDRRTVAQLQAGVAEDAAPTAAAPTTAGATAADVTSGATETADATGIVDTVGPAGDSAAPDDVSPDTTTRIAAGAVPGVGSTRLRPSDIVDEGLFTHRSRHPG